MCIICDEASGGIKLNIRHVLCIVKVVITAVWSFVISSKAVKVTIRETDVRKFSRMGRAVIEKV